TSKAKMNGKDMPTESSRHSSVWVSRNGKWLSAFHQDCPVKKASAPAPAKTAPKAAASPAAAGAATIATSANAEANEKAIWDALKTKNYDGFASAVAVESVEVEPEGVFDKAGSVKTVSQFDFSKSVVSDFKTLKLDDDASLVTYLVKTPG